ncbi:MAG: MFS transporter [Oscillospiraceae bacterium]|nr:MFS transporter [Oscillospiraceae bacterium]
MKKKSKRWTPGFCLLLLMSFFYYSNNYMLNSIVAGYTAELGGQGNIVGIINGTMTFIALILCPVSGLAADRINRKLLSQAGLSLLCLAGILGAFANSVYVLLISRIIQGVGFAFLSVLLSTIVATSVEKNSVGKAIAYYATTQAMAQALAPGMGLWVREMFGYKSVFFVGSCFVLICIFIVFFLGDFGQRSTEKKNGRAGISNFFAVNCTPFVLNGIVCAILLHMIQAYMDPFTETNGHTEGLKAFYTVYAVSMLISRFLLSDIMDKLSLGLVLCFCVPLLLLSFYLIQIQTKPLELWMGGMLCAVGLGTMQIKTQVSVVKKLPIERQGVANSTYYISMNIGHTLGGLLGGAVLESVVADKLFYYCMAISVLPVILMAVFRRQYFEKPCAVGA